MSRKLTLNDANIQLKNSNREISANFNGWEYPCSIKCTECNNVQEYLSYRSGLRGKCHICNDISAHRGNQDLEKFNNNIFKFGWIVDGKYNGNNNPCSFICLKCGNTHYVEQAKSIRSAHCKNCCQNICLNCNKNFTITNKQGHKTTRIFCYECLPQTTTKQHGRYAYNKLYYQYVMKLINIRYGTSCILCGYDKCLEALDFHHKDKTKKEYSPARIIRSNKKIEDIYKELDKCILICSNCHRELHYKERDTL